MLNGLEENGNFVSRFISHARQVPNKTALVLPNMDGQVCISEEAVSYGALLELVNHYQTLWDKKGWQAGDRIIVVLKPSKALYAISLSLLAMGIVPVFIDTGMGRKKIEMAVKDSGAKAIISMSVLLKWYWVMPFLWPLQRFAIDGEGLGYRNLTKELGRIKALNTLVCSPLSNQAHGLISFTSGSTGRPKGADRTHYSLIQQHLAIKDHWPEQASDVDCPCFPVMVLHNLSCGMTTVVPKVDLAQPAAVNARQVIDQIRKEGVTRLSGAPAYLSALVSHLSQQDSDNNTVSNVTSLVVGGATVSKELAAAIRKHFPNAHARIVYGSTEAEPISDLDIDEYLNEPCEGYLVGHIASQIDLIIVDTQSLSFSGGNIQEQELINRRCKQGDVGEIFVSGRHVLKQYVDNPLANRENKIARSGVDSTKAVWHRTGDTGYQDAKGRLWLCGRSKDVITVKGKTIQPYPIEHKIDEFSEVQRCALIEHQGEVYLFVELIPFEKGKEGVFTKVIMAIHECVEDSGFETLNIIQHKKLPMDKRHNSKIDRPALKYELIENRDSNPVQIECKRKGKVQ